MPTFGGEGLPYTAWERREEIAVEVQLFQFSLPFLLECSYVTSEFSHISLTFPLMFAHQMTKWVVANNFTGVHNDWESHVT